MKTGKSRQRDARYLCKVPTDSWRDRLIWWAFRKYLLNEDHFKVHMLFSGPRTTSFNNSYCIKKNAVARRMYVDVRHRPPSSSHSVIRLVDAIESRMAKIQS